MWTINPNYRPQMGSGTATGISAKLEFSASGKFSNRLPKETQRSVWLECRKPGQKG